MESYGLVLTKEGTQYSVEGDWRVVKQQLEEYFSTPGNIDFAKIIAAGSRGIIELVCEKFDMPPDRKKALREFEITQIVPFGLPEYEVSFAIEVKFDTYTMIHPDANNYTEDHINIISENSSGKDRYLLHHLIRCMVTPSHEVLHFVQSALKIKDKSEQSWCLEHGASFPSLSLLTAVNRAGLAPEVFSPGLVEACLVYFHATVKNM